MWGPVRQMRRSPEHQKETGRESEGHSGNSGRVWKEQALWRVGHRDGQVGSVREAAWQWVWELLWVHRPQEAAPLSRVPGGSAEAQGQQAKESPRHSGTSCSCIDLPGDGVSPEEKELPAHAPRSAADPGHRGHCRAGLRALRPHQHRGLPARPLQL